MNDLYTLVIVIPDTAELLIESGELGVVFLRFLINLHHLELSAEDTGEDKFGLVLHTRLFKHREEFFIFLTVRHSVAMHPVGSASTLCPFFIAYKHPFLHDMNILEGSTWENRNARKTFRRDVFEGLKLQNEGLETRAYRYMLTHIKIRLGRIKGLKDLFYVLLPRTGSALPATKVDSFFCPVHHGVSRQHPPMNDFGAGGTSWMLFLRFICSRIAI